jgi:hypothetical protein
MWNKGDHRFLEGIKYQAVQSTAMIRGDSGAATHAGNVNNPDLLLDPASLNFDLSCKARQSAPPSSIRSRSLATIRPAAVEVPPSRCPPTAAPASLAALTISTSDRARGPSLNVLFQSTPSITNRSLALCCTMSGPPWPTHQPRHARRPNSDMTANRRRVSIPPGSFSFRRSACSSEIHLTAYSVRDR